MSKGVGLGKCVCTRTPSHINYLTYATNYRNLSNRFDLKLTLCYVNANPINGGGTNNKQPSK